MPRINHTTCIHERTPAGRAACRLQNDQWLAAMAGQDHVTYGTSDVAIAARAKLVSDGIKQMQTESSATIIARQRANVNEARRLMSLPPLKDGS